MEIMSGVSSMATPTEHLEASPCHSTPLSIQILSTPNKKSNNNNNNNNSSIIIDNNNDPAIIPNTRNTSTRADNDSAADPDRDNGDIDIDTDSGKSSCSPTQLDRSIDSGISGIAAEVSDMQLHKRIQQCKRIIIALERDKEAYHMLRDKLWKIVDKKFKRQTNTEEICNVCCANIDTNDSKSFVECCTCHKRVCRGIKCADWMPKTAEWECQLCHTSMESMAQTSSWVAEQLSFNRQKLIYPMRARSEIYIPISDCHDGSFQFESASQVGVNSEIINADQKMQIREYVEEIVAELLGGSLDKVTVGKLSKSENYLPGILNGRVQSVEPEAAAERNQDVSNLTNASHARLRQLIETIIAETLHTPNLLNGNAVSEITLDTRSNGDIDKLQNGKPGRRHRTEHYFEPKIYQDLLATAVLNKIVDTHGNNVNDKGNSRRISESTPDLSSGHHARRDTNFNVENQSTTSGSSVEPRSDCSYSDTEQLDNEQNLNVNESIMIGRKSALSDYIATHMVPLPDLSTAATESEGDDQASASSSTLAEGTWEDNWLFKKRDSSSITTVATGSAMLVPAPIEVVRAQIGDKAADEASDLSEIGSETDDSSLDLLRGSADPMNERVLNKHLIGGQNTKIVLDEFLDTVSMMSATQPIENEPSYTETKNSHVIKATATTHSEEVNADISSTQLPKANPVILSPPANFKDTDVSPVAQSSNPLAGSIAEREYKKWSNAVEMPNNPYALEALKKRLSVSQERFMDIPNIGPNMDANVITQLEEGEKDTAIDELNKDLENARRYSRDYYINDEKLIPSTVKSSTKGTPKEPPANIAEDDIIINEVIPNGRSSINSPQHRNDSNAFHWTLSTPVRRSSSLKFINPNRNSPQHHFSDRHSARSITPTTMPLRSTKSKSQQMHELPKRAGTPISNYEESLIDENDFYDSEAFEMRSQHSWKSGNSAFTKASRKHIHSPWNSTHSSGSSVGSLNSASSSKKRSLPNANILSQFEKQLLDKDLKRNSFRAISATTKDFVMNPLYDQETFFSKSNVNHDDQGDSGVDSCLNGFNETDTKNSNNSLLF